MKLIDYKKHKETPFPFSKDAVYSDDGDFPFKEVMINAGDVIDPHTGEVVSTLKSTTIDAQPCVKVYKSALKDIMNLSSQGTRILFKVMDELQKKEDEVYLHPAKIAEEYGLKNTRDITEGIKELIEKDILARKDKKHIYFVNPFMLFNGNRVKYEDNKSKQK